MTQEEMIGALLSLQDRLSEALDRISELESKIWNLERRVERHDAREDY